MGRTLNLTTLMQKKFKTYAFTGLWKQVFGLPETHGIWLVFGRDKNGKTWFTLKLMEYLSRFCKVLYMSAEEGVSKHLRDTIIRAKIDVKNSRFHLCGYEPVEELELRLQKRGAPKVVALDNATVYQDELKYGVLRRLEQEHPTVLFILVAHEDEHKAGIPYTSVAKLAKKLAKCIVHVEGLACFVSGRCPGGQLTIDEEKACLYHGIVI